MSGFDKDVFNYIEENSMLSPGDGVIIGVSGGADSVCLLRLLIEYRDKLADKCSCQRNEALCIRVIHINHMIRGKEADRDQSFVEEICRNMDIEYTVHSKDIPAMAKETGLTEEEAGRQFRYECFEDEAWKLEQELHHIYEFTSGKNRPDFLQKKAHFVRIAVAHNKNDLAETVIYNMVRGSSLTGLAGIKPVRGRIIRPLLDSSRVDIEGYLAEIGQDYVTDSTNLVDEYTRNKIRLSIMPVLNEINEGAVDHIVEIAGDLSRLARDTESEINELLNSADYISRKKNVRMETVKKWGDEGREIEKEVCDSISIPIDRLKEMRSFAAGEVILISMENVCGRRKDITRKHINSIFALTEKDTGKHVDLPYDMYAEKNYDSIIIRRNSFKQEDLMDVNDVTLKGRIEISRFPYSEGTDISKKEYTKMIDCDKIKSVPVLRTMNKDDYIVVNSEGGTKKLSRFLSAQKIEKNLRDSIPVVADGDEIIWVVGYRLSERYKVTPDTKTVMRMDYISSENDPSS